MTTTDLQLWRRDGVVPRDMIALSQLRETARVIAIAGVLDSRPAASLPPDPGVSAVVQLPVSEWGGRTLTCIRSGESFQGGLLLTDDLAVIVDRGDYHPKLAGWEFSLYRPATGLRSVYEEEATAVLLVAEDLNIPVAAVYLKYLDKGFSVTTEGDHSWSELFRESNVTRRARKQVENLRNAIAAARLSERKPREERPRGVSDQYDVLTLHKGRETGRKLRDRGITDIREIPPGSVKLTSRQEIQIQAVRDGSLHVDRDALTVFLNRIIRPCYFLDFEAYSQSIPPFDGVHPYEHVPVLASLHWRYTPGGEVHHDLYVAEPGRESRAGMFQWLRRHLGDAGTIVVFSKPFESSMVRQLALAANDPEGGNSVISRMIDLLTPFADFLVYHPEQMGKVSLKRVLPIYTDDSYEEMDVQDGMHANLSWTMMADTAVPESEELLHAGARAALSVDHFLRQRSDCAWLTAATREQISAYCTVDTLAMVTLVDRLTEMCRQNGQ